MSIYKRVDLSAEDRAEKLPRELLEQINKLHSSNYTENIEVEKLLLKERLKFNLGVMECCKIFLV